MASYAEILSGLIWVQTVCKGYQQTTVVNKELKVWFSKRQITEYRTNFLMIKDFFKFSNT